MVTFKWTFTKGDVQWDQPNEWFKICYQGKQQVAWWKGLPRLTVKPSLQTYAETRAQEVVNKFSHIRPNGKRTAYEESIGLNSVQVSNTPKEAAKVLLDEFIYHDQASNWAHRKSLLSKANKTIGVGFAFEAKPGMATQGNKYPDYLGDRIAVDLQTH